MDKKKKSNYRQSIRISLRRFIFGSRTHNTVILYFIMKKTTKSADYELYNINNMFKYEINLFTLYPDGLYLVYDWFRCSLLLDCIKVFKYFVLSNWSVWFWFSKNIFNRIIRSLWKLSLVICRFLNDDVRAGWDLRSVQSSRPKAFIFCLNASEVNNPQSSNALWEIHLIWYSTGILGVSSRAVRVCVCGDPKPIWSCLVKFSHRHIPKY